ncbi:MAG: N-acetyl-gamma-glutamyl-phosphate reductase [Dehalococcoidales bacterium]|nr:N-acetyl-gamma-glutamyl-phosphate reductase [Dehalococcoidales bacterium]
MSKTKVGIINVTGYAGVELARLLSKHPSVELVSVTGRSAAGQPLKKIFPHLANIDLTIQPELGKVDLAFSAMPHKESAKEIIPLVSQGIKIVDISSDFRLKDINAYPTWYSFNHPAPEMLEKAVFGLPELHRNEIIAAQLVANPGCYPTGAILALAPAVKAGLIKPDIIVDSKSGVSGAGRTLSLTTHYSEVNDDVGAYAIDGHRHLPEITQELGLLNTEFKPEVTFVPHLIPMTRGILTTGYASLYQGKLSSGTKGREELRELYIDFYKNEPYVRVMEAPPHTKHTWGSNFCHIFPTVDIRTNRLIVISAIDNLVKGAAGQAVQNMNVMLGLPETTGIDMPAMFP